jgi:hypothetical protein
MRKIILSDRKVRNYVWYALGEVLLLVIGILIALQINNWNENRLDRKQEYQYLVRLREDLQFEIGLMTDAIRHADNRIAAVRLLEEAAANPEIAIERPNVMALALETVTWRSFPKISAFVYTELQGTGHLSLIRSEALLRDIAAYYSSIQKESDIGVDLEIQNLFTRGTAGILLTTELIAIQEHEFGQREGVVEIVPDRGLKIAHEFSARQNTVDLLPSIAQHHTFNRVVIEASRNKALELIVMIDSLIKEFGS